MAKKVVGMTADGKELKGKVNASNIMAAMSNPNNWKKTHKKLYDVYVCKPPVGTQVSNIFEGSQYVTNEQKSFVLSGTQGEQWIVDEGKLTTTYNTQGLKLREDGYLDWTRITTRQDNTINWAFHVPLSVQNMPVQTAWGDVLYANRTGVKHGSGDFLVCSDAGGRPNLQDVWVVNGMIFPNTYDLHNFGNEIRNSIKNTNTVVPQKSLLPVKNDSTKVDNKINNRLDINNVFREVINDLDWILRCDRFSIRITNGFLKAKIQVIATPDIFDGYECKTNESVVLFLSADADKNILSCKGKHGGNSLNYNISIIKLAESIKSYNFNREIFQASAFIIALSLYYDICKCFRITPYRFATKVTYLHMVTEEMNNCLYTMREKLSDNSITRFAINNKTVQSDYNKENSIASVKFNLGIFTDNVSVPKYNYACKLNFKLTKQGMMQNIKELKAIIEGASVDSKSFYDVYGDKNNAFKGTLVVAYGASIDIELPYGLMLYMMAESFTKGIKSEWNRQKGITSSGG